MQLNTLLSDAWNAVANIELADARAKYVILTLLGATAFLAGLGIFRKALRWRTLGAFIGAVVLTAAAWVVMEKTWKPFPDRVPAYIYVCGSLAVFVLLGAVLQRGRRIVLGLLTPLAFAMSFGVFNLEFQEYPTVRSLNPQPVAVQMNYEEFQRAAADRRPPEIDGEPAGAIVTVDLPATQFEHRPAVAYVPPAYFTEPKLELPVYVIMAGNPGSPQQWYDAGDAENTMDNYQRAHRGRSPILISVDGTGGFTNNPICVDSKDNKVQTYLAKDVPQAIKERFRVVPDQQKWTIGGLSYGGTCALQVVTNYPDSYGTFLDYSGQREPTLGQHQETVDRFFGGDEAAFQAVNPLTLLEQAKGTPKYRHLHGKFIVGAEDKHFKEDMQIMHKAAVDAGINAAYEEVPGGHSFQVWRVALRETIGYVAQRGGLK
ncbi:alpha/beta hydrolase-fold protein [Staphylococcus chromogenes]|nr:alpha/beta hydrolase-fold protein [Staphylococcus chromogenes]